MKTVIALSCLIFALAACNSATPTPAATAVPSPTLVKQPSATLTKAPLEATVQQPRPTITPAPTRTPTETPTATSTPWSIPTKQVLLQYGVFGGDGGYNTDSYLGRGTPQLVLYTDGQLLLLQTEGAWYVQETLTDFQICSLLSRIKHTGFFEIEGDGGDSTADPIYAVDGPTQFGGGGPDYVIQVNGQPHKIVHVYSDYERYLIQPVSSTLKLMKKYTPKTYTMPFETKYLVLWIEKGLGNAAYIDPQPTPQPWPSQLPSLSRLLGDKNEGQSFIEGEAVAPILKMFGNRPTDILFTEEDQEYYVIARPLLPHETPEKFSIYPYEDVESALPFKCQ